MEICKAPTLQLRALNKHNITHIMYIKMEMLSAIKMYIRKQKQTNTQCRQGFKRNYAEDACTHTHTVQTDKVKVVIAFGQITILQKFVFCYSYLPFICKTCFFVSVLLMSTETIRCIGTGSPGQPPHLSHSS